MRRTTERSTQVPAKIIQLRLYTDDTAKSVKTEEEEEACFVDQVVRDIEVRRVQFVERDTQQ